MTNPKKTLKNYNDEFITPEFIEKDQVWDGEITRYWFKCGNEIYGVLDHNGDRSEIVYGTGEDVNTDDPGNVWLKDLHECITEEMEME